MYEAMQCFWQFVNKKIALYGLGNETEIALRRLGGSFHIIGLLDSFREDGEIIYGLPVIPLSDAIEAGVEVIIVVARPGSCKAIAKKIGDRCKKNSIALFDIRGKDLLAVSRVTYDFSKVEGITRAELLEYCEKADVVSFDMFDTIVMRRIYEPTDIIELVNSRLQDQGINIKDFYSKRLAVEKELSKTNAPMLTDIYRKVIDLSWGEDLPDGITAEYLADMEWRLDYEMLVPRHDVVVLFNTLKYRNKLVYVISDTYYSKEQISLMLVKCGIKEYTDILPSCEFKTGKTQKLFEVLNAKEKGKKILHIGDDALADIKCAQESGIEACRLYSGYSLMEFLGYLGLEKYIDNLSDKIRVGMFVANIFNSPFQFETEEKRIEVNNSYDIGYLFCAPLIFDFVYWFQRRVEEEGISNIWFGARDGFLIQKMYGQLLKSQNKEDVSIYFLTSRVAAIRAGIQYEEDIRYVDSMKYHGTLEENLKERFGIESGDIAETDIFSDEYGLLRYKKLDIESFYRAEETETSAIFDHYYILETLLTAPHPSVAAFNELGEPVYAEETRSDEDIACFGRAQSGILSYMDTYTKLCPVMEWKGNKKLDEALLGLIQGVEIKDNDFLNLMIEDPFFNRITKITDVL